MHFLRSRIDTQSGPATASWAFGLSCQHRSPATASPEPLMAWTTESVSGLLDQEVSTLCGLPRPQRPAWWISGCFDHLWPLGSNDKSSIHKAPTPGGNSSSPRPCSHWAPGCPCSKVTVRTICKNHPCDCMAEVQGDLFQSLAQNWVQQ